MLAVWADRISTAVEDHNTAIPACEHLAQEPLGLRAVRGGDLRPRNRMGPKSLAPNPASSLGLDVLKLIKNRLVQEAVLQILREKIVTQGRWEYRCIALDSVRREEASSTVKVPIRFPHLKNMS